MNRLDRLSRLVILAGVLIVVCAAVTACGGSDNSSTGTTESKSPGSGGSVEGRLKAAQEVVSKYEKGPTPFPVDEPLKAKIGPGEEVGLLQCPAPYCALISEIDQSASAKLGTSLGVVKASDSTESLQGGLESIRSKQPAALVLGGVNRAELGDSLQGFSEDGIPVVTIAVMGGKAQGIDLNVNSEKAIEVAGEVLADWAIVKGAEHGEVIWFEVPELDFSKYETEAFKQTMEKNCPDCSVGYATTPLSTIGTTAPSMVVSELQSHPEANVALFASLEAATGLPAALKAAGIEVQTAGYAATPGNLEDIKSGGLTAAIAVDSGILAYTQIDAAMRLATGQKPTKQERAGIPVFQLVEKGALRGDVSKGWVGYPDFEEKFERLWSGAKAE